VSDDGYLSRYVAILATAAVLGVYAWYVNSPPSEGEPHKAETGGNRAALRDFLARTGERNAQNGTSLLRCEYIASSGCSATGSCATGSMEDGYLLAPRLDELLAATEAKSRVQVQRCDREGCTAVEGSVARSGRGYLTFGALDRGYLVKFSLDELEGSGRFVELASIGLSVIVHQGICPQ
jgi:hypothetical protein